MMISVIKLIINIQIQMQQYTQVGAYKHLLQVTENILYSLQPDSEILKKYQSLKRAILNKIKFNHNNHHNASSLNSDAATIFQKKLTQSYKSIIQNLLDSLTSFQSQIQIEGTQEQSRYQVSAEQFANQIKNRQQKVNKQISSLKEIIQQHEKQFDFKNQSKKYEIHFQNSQLSSFITICDLYKTKLQNFQLMVEVHRKMHQIIIRASENQRDRIQKQHQLRNMINCLEQEKVQLQRGTHGLAQTKRFLNQYKLTDQSLNKYKIASKKLMKVLYES